MAQAGVPAALFEPPVDQAVGRRRGGPCVDMCVDMCRDMCIGMCIDMSIDTCVGMCIVAEITAQTTVLYIAATGTVRRAKVK